MPVASRIMMRNHGRRLPALAAVLTFSPILFAQGATPAQNQTANELWPEADIFWKLNQTLRLEFTANSTRDQDQSDFDHSIAGYLNISVPRFKPILFRRISKLDDARMQRIRLRVGYQYHHSFRETPAIIEHRPLVEGTWNWVFPYELLVSNRNRFEFRIKNGVYSWRYRNRLKLEREFNIGAVAMAPFVSGEAFYDSAPGAWNRFRFEAGLEFPVERHLSIRPYYARQIMEYSAVRNVNAVGLTFLVYIK